MRGYRVILAYRKVVHFVVVILAYRKVVHCVFRVVLAYRKVVHCVLESFSRTGKWCIAC